MVVCCDTVADSVLYFCRAHLLLNCHNMANSCVV